MAQTPQEIILDTDILIDYLRGLSQAVSFLDSLDHRAVSAITAMEIIKGAKSKRKLKINLSFLDAFEIVDINEGISDQAVDLMKRHNLRKDLTIMDALIAATALSREEKLVTRNIKDFEFIEGLETYQPYNVI